MCQWGYGPFSGMFSTGTVHSGISRNPKVWNPHSTDYGKMPPQRRLRESQFLNISGIDILAANVHRGLRSHCEHIFCG